MKQILSIAGACVALFGLFVLAGNIAWWHGWAFLAFTGFLGVLTTRAIARTPGLADERRTAGDRAKTWDRPLVMAINSGPLLMLILAALDSRGGMTRMPLWLCVVSYVAALPAAFIVAKSVATNAFFSSHVRIQEDRGHVVIDTGPYRIVRHPGYAGAAMFNLLAPLMLGSWLAFAPALLVVALLICRTGKEDRVLKEELAGYADYAAQVSSRMIPYVW